MRIKAALGLGVLALAFAAAFAAPPTDLAFVGKWTATASSPGGDSIETLTVVKAGNGFALTAKAAVPPPEGVVVSPGVDIVLEGSKFSYKRTVTTPGGIIVISYTGVVSGDTFTGTAELGGTKIPYTGVRIKGGG
jgi:hypothetical protein